MQAAILSGKISGI